MEELTPREKEICFLVAKNLTSQEIADKLNIKYNTVISFLNRIFKKLNIKKRGEIIRLVFLEKI